MMSKTRSRAIHAGPTAIVVRLAAFLAAAAGAVAIPTALIATATGHVSHQSAAVMVTCAVASILVAAVAVRPFDPI